MKKLPAFSTDDADLQPLVDGLNRLVECDAERTPLKGEECPIDFFPNGFRPKPKPPGGSQPASEVQQYRVQTVRMDYLVCRSYQENYTLVDGVYVRGAPTVGTTDVQIAKPFTLRPTEWDYTERAARGVTDLIDGRRYDFVNNGIHTGIARRLDKWNYRTVTISDNPQSRDDSGNYAESFIGVTMKEKIWPEYIEGQSIILAAKVKESPLVKFAEVLYTDPSSGITTRIESVDCDLEDLNVDGRRWEMLWTPIYVCFDNGDGTFTRRRVMVRTTEYVS